MSLIDLIIGYPRYVLDPFHMLIDLALLRSLSSTKTDPVFNREKCVHDWHRIEFYE